MNGLCLGAAYQGVLSFGTNTLGLSPLETGVRLRRKHFSATLTCLTRYGGAISRRGESRTAIRDAADGSAENRSGTSGPVFFF
jgi:hypothetical protein